ncbi:hypothetical protein [Rickettsia canadensis]
MKLGKNIVATKGKVMFQNDFMLYAINML